LGAFAMAPVRLAVDALSMLDVEVVLATMADQLEMLGPVPANVRPVRSVPLHMLLPACSLIVHQAGDGTSLTACGAGLPQLPITRKPDPALTGGRLAAVGAAIHLRYQELEREPDAREVVRT